MATKAKSGMGAKGAKKGRIAGRSKPAARKSLYSLHPGFQREAAYQRNLVERTGRSLDEWVVLTRIKGPKSAKERVDWLKSGHGLGTDYAKWIAASCEEDVSSASYDPEALVETMFTGKEPLRPIYDRLLEMGLALGDDVKACPCATIVPLYRKHVFAQLKPTTRTRIDLGFPLGDPAGIKTPARLLDTGGFAKKDRITHRIPIASLAEIDREVERWLRVAYDRDA